MRWRDSSTLFFAVAAAAVAVLAVVDNARPWRHTQVRFFELERQRLEARIAEARARDAEVAAELAPALAEAAARVAERGRELAELRRDLRGFEAEARAARLRRERLRGRLAAEPALAERLRQIRIEIESLDELAADRRAKIDALRADLDELETRAAEAVAPVETLSRELAAARGGRWWGPARIFHPRIRVRALAPALRRGEVERCVTCHLAADRPEHAGDGVPPPLGAHPRLALFVAPGSPHPQTRFGCVACHGGFGRATDFTLAGHRPETPAEEAAWVEQHGYRPAATAPAPMLPASRVEAGCVPCHGAAGRIPGAPVADAGRRLVARLGCAGCHPTDHPALAGVARAGPSLRALAAKTDPAWVRRWLAAPRALRPRTAMPHLFDERTAGAEIAAVVAYLWHASRPASYRASPPQGDREAGAALFDAVGCAACHRDVSRSASRPHGPDLAGLGDKVAPAWLYAWLRDPRAYDPATPMPSLRLSDGEAADLVAHLLSRRDPDPAPAPPAPDPATRDALVRSHLETTGTVEAAAARLAAMSERERDRYLGERTIARYGCHGCHEIPGFDGAPPVAPALDVVARRVRRDAALGCAAVDPRPGLPDYALTEAESRAVATFLHGLAPVAPELDPDRLDSDRLDHGGLDPGELGPDRLDLDPRAAASYRAAGAPEFVAAGLAVEPIGAADAERLAAGRALIERYGCRACHRIEPGDDDRDRDPRRAPPDLIHAGARLRAEWLFDFLGDPGGFPVRPWLAVRMPTFALDEDEKNVLIAYLAALDGRALLSAAPEPGTPRDLAVGRAVYELLQCGSCHLGGGDRTDFGGLSVPEPAPPYRLARARLRPDWVLGWILDPQRLRPGTAMPASFRPGDGDALDSAYLAGSLQTPIFADQRARLRRHFESEEALEAYLADPRRVAAALRDYLWSLGDGRPEAR